MHNAVNWFLRGIVIHAKCNVRSAAECWIKANDLMLRLGFNETIDL